MGKKKKTHGIKTLSRKIYSTYRSTKMVKNFNKLLKLFKKTRYKTNKTAFSNVKFCSGGLERWGNHAFLLNFR